MTLACKYVVLGISLFMFITEIERPEGLGT